VQESCDQIMDRGISAVYIYTQHRIWKPLRKQSTWKL
jgi:hypothetical protein